MKKLLLLFLMAITFANAQVNVTEGFESGFPAGWIQENTGGVVTNTSSCGGTKSVAGNLWSNLYSIIYTSSYVSNGEAIAVSFNARKATATFQGYGYLYYELNGSGVWNQIANVNADFSTCVSVNATIAAGVIPNGSSVKFRMQINLASGGAYVYFDNFSAVQQLPVIHQTIAEYSFDNTYNNISSSEPFFQSAATSFVADRYGNSDKALNINNAAADCYTTITNLPIGNAARSVSIWVKPNVVLSDNIVFMYGTGDANSAYGLSFKSNLINNFGWANDLSVAVTNTANVWKHIVCTYDSTTAKIYVDGFLVSSGTKPTWNTANNTFKLGYGFANIAVDDLKICNYALSQAEVTNLYTNNSLSVSDFSKNNLQASVYPNPTSDILNIQMEKELKMATIYTVLGDQVLVATAKQIDVSSLTSGNYFVRIEAVDGAVTTQKIIIK